MNKQELVEKVKYLLKKNKTEEALKLLSKAQLSENDKTVIILMGQMARLQQDSLINKITNEEKNRIQDSINKSILDLSEKIDPNEVKLGELEIKSDVDDSIENITDTEIINRPEIIPPTKKKDSFFEKNKKYLFLILLLPLAYFILQNRTKAPKQEYGEKLSTIENLPDKYSSTDMKIPASPQNFWKETTTIYFEDFTDRKAVKFRNDIWSHAPNSDDYWLGVENDEYYVIKLLNNKFKSKHKYLGRMEYHSDKDFIAYKAVIRLDENSNCKGNNCLGRGITIDYNNKDKSAYSLTVNDDGNVSFSKLYDFRNPAGAKRLFNKKIDVSNRQSIELGIANFKNNYFLFIDGNLETELEIDSPLKGQYCGVIAAGVGNHLFDKVILNK